MTTTDAYTPRVGETYYAATNPHTRRLSGAPRRTQGDARADRLPGDVVQCYSVRPSWGPGSSLAVDGVDHVARWEWWRLIPLSA